MLPQGAFHQIVLAQSGLREMAESLGDAADVVRGALDVLPTIPLGVTDVPSLAVLALALVGWRARATGQSSTAAATSAILSALALWAVWALGFGSELEITLAITLLGTAIALAIGYPIGRALGPYREGHDRAGVRPFDFLAKVPEFVFLVPVVIYFSIGNGAAVILAALVGLFVAVSRVRQVSQRNLGGVRMLSATLNATALRVYAAVILASLINAAGLGRILFTAINTIDVELGLQAAAATVLFAFVLDRLTDDPLGPRSSPDAETVFEGSY